MEPYRHILAPTDFSEASRRATEHAIELASAFGAKLTIMHAFEVPAFTYVGMPVMPVDVIAAVEEAARSSLDAEVEVARKKVPGAMAELRKGVPWQAIIAAAGQVGADLIVMGTHGRRGVVHAMIGSVTEKVVRHASTHVLTIRTPAR